MADGYILGDCCDVAISDPDASDPFIVCTVGEFTEAETDAVLAALRHSGCRGCGRCCGNGGSRIGLMFWYESEEELRANLNRFIRLRAEFSARLRNEPAEHGPCKQATWREFATLAETTMAEVRQLRSGTSRGPVPPDMAEALRRVQPALAELERVRQAQVGAAMEAIQGLGLLSAPSAKPAGQPEVAPAQWVETQRVLRAALAERYLGGDVRVDSEEIRQWTVPALGEDGAARLLPVLLRELEAEGLLEKETAELAARDACLWDTRSVTTTPAPCEYPPDPDPRPVRRYRLTRLPEPAGPAISAAAGDGESDTAPKAEGVRSERRLTVNERMAATLASRPEAKDWTAEQFAEYLGCAKGTVAETVTWKGLMAARERSKRERMARASDD